uniref:Transposase n=1 Tax=Haemonchus contortus TaxID=6289 RepID=A0A7I4YGQ6_HAECO
MAESAGEKWTPAQREEDQVPQFRREYGVNYRRSREATEKIQIFGYLGSDLVVNGSVDQAGKARMNAAWMKWREFSGILCDRRCSRTLK